MSSILMIHEEKADLFFEHISFRIFKLKLDLLMKICTDRKGDDLSYSGIHNALLI